MKSKTQSELLDCAREYLEKQFGNSYKFSDMEKTSGHLIVTYEKKFLFFFTSFVEVTVNVHGELMRIEKF
jgi:hypothetical protein